MNPRASLLFLFGGWLTLGCAPAATTTGAGSGGAGAATATGGSPSATGGTTAGSGGANPGSAGMPGGSGGMPGGTGGQPGSGSGGEQGQAGAVGTGSGGAVGSGGAAGSAAGGGGGSSASSGGRAGGGTGGGAGRAGAGSGGAGGVSGAVAKFSFFVASYPSLAKLAGKPEGFGGDLRFGKADGLAGADEICRQVAELGLPGAGQKTWRAFLSTTTGSVGMAVNARDRIGAGPWHDVMGRLVANNLDGLFAGDRPAGEAIVVNDLPNEFGQPNHYVGPGGLGATVVDNHDTLTGSDATGRVRATGAADTCNNWTSTTVAGRPWIGHSWPRNPTSGRQWASDHQVPGCVPGVDRTLGGTGTGSCVGCSGGYGGFYCFALP